MKSELIELMMRAERLLQDCGWPEQAAWWHAKVERLDGLEPASEEFQQEIKEIRSILVGMGSFTDVPLYPPADYPLDEIEARRLQGDLAEEIGAVIRKLSRTRA